jgi:hypothetical protein
LCAAQDDFDSYKIRFDGDWLYANPSGNIQGVSDKVPVDLNRDLAFNTYSTFVGKVDWKFTRKNHLYFAAGNLSRSRQTKSDDCLPESDLQRRIGYAGFQSSLLSPHAGCHHLSALLSNQKRLPLAEVAGYAERS